MSTLAANSHVKPGYLIKPIDAAALDELFT